jgi:hypothetical protein
MLSDKAAVRHPSGVLLDRRIGVSDRPSIQSGA